MYSYDGLTGRLKAKGITKTELSHVLGISSKTLSKISKKEKISSPVLKKIADYLECPVSEIYEEISDNRILRILREEKNAKISGGLYHEFQVRMTYNSNHMEGSRLSEDQTRLIFETRTLDAQDDVLVDDIIETSNHFRAIDYCIDSAEEELSEEIIKHLHYLLKRSTKDESISWFAVGDYKKRPNVVGGKETAKPKDVPAKMKKLVADYLSKGSHTIGDIIAFHSDFEHIHPFQDGNGRVGRLIVFRECLHYNIIPFLIEDQKKSYYYRGLSQWENEKGWLTDTCLDGQDTFRRLMQMFDIPTD